MNKKTYQAPIIKKVSLEVKNAVLSVCHSSMIQDSAGLPLACRLNDQCAQAAPLP